MTTVSDSGRGWAVVAGAAIGLMFGGATLPLYTLGVFVRPLHDTFGWPRSSILLTQLIFIHALLVASVLGGWIVDRWNARISIVTSGLCLGASLVGMYFLNSDIRWLYGGYVGMAIGGCCTLPVPLSKVIARWFDHRRGLALGAALTGVGLGSAVLPFATSMVIERFGWRNAFLMLGLSVLLLATPMLAVFVREHPEQVRPRGDPARRNHKSRESGETLATAVREKTFWTLFGAVVLLGAACGGVIPQIPAMMMDQGMTPRAAALAVSATGIATIIGRVLMGYLLDYFFAAPLGIVFSIPAIVALPLLANGISAPWAVVCTSALGLALGMEGDLLAYLCSRYFGLKEYGRIYGLLFGAYLVGAAWAGLLLAKIYDRVGNYRVATYVLAAGGVLSCVLLSRLRQYKTREATRLAEAPLNQPGS